MNRYKITIEYDGTYSAGWQRQNHTKTFQEHLEDAIFAFSGEHRQTFAAGRTDAGVHALGQVVHFDLAKFFEPKTVMGALNYYLKDRGIVICKAEIVSLDFHARFSAISRSYRYHILNRDYPTVIHNKRAWFVREELDFELMHKTSQMLIGTHDFSSFRAQDCQAKNPIRTVQKIQINKVMDFIYIDITAKSFLYHMVRNIVGTLRLVGGNKITEEEFLTILQAKNRAKAGPTAPAYGLYLTEVKYND